MKTEHQLGQLHGKDTRGGSSIAKAVMQTSRDHFNSRYGEHAELLGVGATFTPPSVKEGAEHAYEK